MKRNHYLILGGIALIGGYLWYQKRDKAEKEKKAKTLALSTNVVEPMKDGESSNFSGARCTCDNGFTSWCAHGDCNKCCGSFNRKKRPTETRTFNF